jgi:hypothetical protein
MARPRQAMARSGEYARAPHARPFAFAPGEPRDALKRACILTQKRRLRKLVEGGMAWTPRAPQRRMLAAAAACLLLAATAHAQAGHYGK